MGFLEKHPQYTELSERKILEWALRSGLWRPKSHSYKASNDRPDMNFGIPHIDQGNVKNLLYAAASVQSRHLVVMEVRGNLIKQERIEALKKFRLAHFKKVAQ